MEKPVIMIVEELKENCAKLINESNLHPVVLLPIIKDIYIEVEQAYKIQYEKEKKEYEQSQSEK